MKSLVVTSLLAGSLLFMSGCGTDDVKDALGIKENVVWMLNGYATDTITGTVQSDSETLIPGGLQPFINAEESLNVSYTLPTSGTLGAVSLATDKVHAYVATDCSGSESYLTHAVDTSNLIQVTNLTSTAITNGRYTLTINDSEVLGALDSAAACATTKVPATTTMGLVVVRDTVDAEEYNATLDGNYAFDVVILPNEEIRIIPLLGFGEAANYL